MYCLQILLPVESEVRYKGVGEIQHLKEEEIVPVDDQFLTVHDDKGKSHHVCLSDTAEIFGFQYMHRLAFLHAADLRNIPFWGIDLDSNISEAEDEVGELLDRAHVCESICIKYIGVIGDSGIDVGYGVFADKDIKQGTFIGEYVGIVFQSSTLSESCYALNYPCKEGGYVIDSNEVGNILRMVNHSDDFNCSFQNVFHDNLVHVICVSSPQHTTMCHLWYC